MPRVSCCCFIKIDGIIHTICGVHNTKTYAHLDNINMEIVQVCDRAYAPQTSYTSLCIVQWLRLRTIQISDSIKILSSSIYHMAVKRCLAPHISWIYEQISFGSCDCNIELILTTTIVFGSSQPTSQTAVRWNKKQWYNTDKNKPKDDFLIKQCVHLKSSLLSASSA